MNYYDKKQYLASVNQGDAVLQTVEKWAAHRENILHRGYTAIIRYGEEVALQHRKHPVFDDVLDLSFSSHPVYQGKSLQGMEEAIYEGLVREWGIGREDVATEPKFIRKVYYQAKDGKSSYFEHEIDYIYEVTVRSVPKAEPDFAYGVYLVKPGEIAGAPARFSIPFAPWVNSMLEEHLV